MTLARLVWPVIVVGLFAGCSKTTEEQMTEYIEFYYPTTGSYTYDIVFEWGSYVITTGEKPGEEVHADSKPYLGYIVMRPEPKEVTGGSFPIYLITPEGSVWTHAVSDSIAEIRTREEVVVEKSESGTSTTTTTINSPLEPVVDHFLAHREEWKSYGMLEQAGEKYRLERSASTR